MPAGRPTIYNDELVSEICQRIADGESLRSICRDDHMPHKATVLLWVVDGKHSQFRDQYVHAREAAGFSHADEALELRHSVLDGTYDPQAARVALDALKWGAERMAPKKHSTRQEIDHSSSDGTMTPQGVDASMLSTGALRELIAARAKTDDK